MSTENTDPIAQAISQMEEAARVLGNCLEMRGVPLRMMFMPEMVYQSRQSSSSLSEALGYKSPQQEREEKLKEADAKMQEAKHLFDKANEIEAQAADLIKESKKLREEAGL